MATRTSTKTSRSKRPNPNREVGGRALDAVMRVAVYLRISTDEEHQPYSLEAQEHRLRAYVTSQGWTLARVYREQCSGATLDRPELARALADAAAGAYDLLLVYRVDRLARSVRGLAQILEDLDRADVAFRSATEPFDTSTPAGRMMVQMLGVFAEFERATIIDRVIAGMERKAARGEFVAGSLPFGYAVERSADKGPRVLVVEEDRAPLVPVIFDLYVNQRLGSQVIAGWLNERGHRTRAGKPWGHTAVLTLLRNRSYVGEVFFRGTWYAASHPTLVDAEVFERAQRLLEHRSEDVSSRASNPSEYLLAGVVFCARCGKRFVGTAATGNRYRYRYYTCFSRSRYGRATCDADRLPADELEETILSSLLATYRRHDLFSRAVRSAVDEADAGQERHAEELRAVEAEIAKAEDALDRYLAAFEDGTLSPVQCSRRMAGLDERLTDLRLRHAELQSRLMGPAPTAPTKALLDAVRARIEEVMGDGADSQRKALMRALVHEVRVVGRDHIEPVFRVLDPGADEVRIVDGWVGPAGIEPATERL